MRRDDAGMMSFDEFRSHVPEIADPMLARLEATGLAILGTIRRDGSPRVSPIEVVIRDGRLFVGMMPGSTKHRDVTRDPRVSLLTPVADRHDVAGEGKLFARLEPLAQDVADRMLAAHAEQIGMDAGALAGSPLYEVLVEGAAWQGVQDDSFCTVSWRVGERVRHRRRVGATEQVVDVEQV